MPVSNLAKIFGPTILGYSSATPDQHAIFTETMIQANVMSHLLEVPTDYWGKFLIYDSADSHQNETGAAGRSYFGTPQRNGNMTLRRAGMFDTPPFSAKKTKH